jgi:hypothetical protein
MHMKIPYRFETKEITEEDVRALQERHLRGTLLEDDRWLIDAIMSWFSIFLANDKGEAQPPAK